MATNIPIIDSVVLNAISDLVGTRKRAIAAAKDKVMADWDGNINYPTQRMTLHSYYGVDQIDLASIQYLDNFLREDGNVTELIFNHFRLSLYADGGLEVLYDFFATNNMLLKVTMYKCQFGNQQETMHLLSAFQTSPNVTYLHIEKNYHMDGNSLGTCFSGILQNNVHLQRLECPNWQLRNEGMHAMQPGLRVNDTIKELILSNCNLSDEGIRFLADSLVDNNNSALKLLDISHNCFTSTGLGDITRILEHTTLKKINFSENDSGLYNEENIRGFAHVLSRTPTFLKTVVAAAMGVNTPIFHALADSTCTLKNLQLGHFSQRNLHQHQSDINQLIDSLRTMKSLRRLGIGTNDWEVCVRQDAFLPALHDNVFLEELWGLDHQHYPIIVAKFVAIKTLLARNLGLNRTKALLDLQSRTYMPILSKSGIWHKVVGKLATVRIKDRYGTIMNEIRPGASAIFHLFRTRPAILERCFYGTSTRWDTELNDKSSNRMIETVKSSSCCGIKRQRL